MISNLTKVLQSRQVQSDVDKKLDACLIGRLNVTDTLEGDLYNSALTWNNDGSLLMSGAHDELRIWSYPDKILLHNFSTDPDRKGVLSAKFVADTPNRVLSGGVNKRVQLFDVNHNNVRLASYGCHLNRVQDVAVLEGSPQEILSASGDGTVRKHDFREASQCHPRRCNKVLLDLRSAHQLSLDKEPRDHLWLNSFDIFPTRPYSVLVGGSDCFARLYDIRNQSLSEIQVKKAPPTCVEYYCPKHLSNTPLHRQKQISHVKFKPDGSQALINYREEHVYLIDLNQAKEYDSYDVFQMTETLCYNRGKYRIIAGGDAELDCGSKKTRDDINKLVCELDPYHAIDKLSSSLTLRYRNDFETYDRLCTRASLFLKREWYNDIYMAIRDCDAAKDMGYSDYKLYYTLAEGLSKMGKHREALAFAEFANYLDPSNLVVQYFVQNIRMIIESKSNVQAKSFSGVDEDPDDDFDRIFDFLDAFPSSASESSDDDRQYNFEFVQDRFAMRKAFDIEQRFIGQLNLGTKKKQASFVGQKGEYIACGSDDGMLYIFEKCSGKLISRRSGDEHAVICVENHPKDLAIATSGIDAEIKIWTPDVCDQYSLIENGLVGMNQNQRELSAGRRRVLPESVRDLIVRSV